MHDCVGRAQRKAHVAWTDVCMLISRVFPERPDRCTAHSRSPNSLWHSAENSDILSYLLSAATIYIPQKNLSSNRSPTSLPSTRPWPRVRALPASRIILLEMEATVLAAFHRQGVFAGLSADQCEHAIVHRSGLRVGLLGPKSSCLSCYFSSALIWNSLKWGRPVFPLGESLLLWFRHAHLNLERVKSINAASCDSLGLNLSLLFTCCTAKKKHAGNTSDTWSWHNYNMFCH